MIQDLDQQSFATTTPTIRTSTYEQSVDYYHDGDYFTFNAPNAGVCEDACLSSLRCKAWTFHGGKNTCSLKDQFNRSRLAPNIVSGRVFVNQVPTPPTPPLPPHPTPYLPPELPPYLPPDLPPQPAPELPPYPAPGLPPHPTPGFPPRPPGIPPRPTPTPAPTGQSIHLQGVDCPGANFSSFLRLNANACKTACLKNPQCKAWTFSPDQRICHLKNRYQPCVASGNKVSGIIVDRPAPPPVAHSTPDYMSFEDITEDVSSSDTFNGNAHYLYYNKTSTNKTPKDVYQSSPLGHAYNAAAY